jgi:hypothetical protein
LYCTQVLAWQAGGGVELGVGLGLGLAEVRVAEGVGDALAEPDETVPVHETPLNLITPGVEFVPEYEPLNPKLTDALVPTAPL